MRQCFAKRRIVRLDQAAGDGLIKSSQEDFVDLASRPFVHVIATISSRCNLFLVR